MSRETIEMLIKLRTAFLREAADPANAQYAQGFKLAAAMILVELTNDHRD